MRKITTGLAVTNRPMPCRPIHEVFMFSNC